MDNISNFLSSVNVSSTFYYLKKRGFGEDLSPKTYFKIWSRNKKVISLTSPTSSFGISYF